MMRTRRLRARRRSHATVVDEPADWHCVRPRPSVVLRAALLEAGVALRVLQLQDGWSRLVGVGSDRGGAAQWSRVRQASLDGLQVPLLRLGGCTG